MIDWDDMRVFLGVARARSLSAAAPGLRMDPATVGRRIARLEESLGAALFLKSPQGYALTDLGQRLQGRAEEAEEALRLALEEGQGGAQGLTGRCGSARRMAARTSSSRRSRRGSSRESGPRGADPGAAARRQPVRREADLAITVSPPDAGRLTVQKITDYHLHLASAATRRFPPPLRTCEAGRSWATSPT
jgi:DNA-binding transcriptional LysR family regulator